MNPKYVFGAIAIIAILIAGAILLNMKSNSDDQAAQQAIQKQQADNSTAATSQPAASTPNQQQNSATSRSGTLPAITAQNCTPPAGYHGTDANGRFKPTVDIASKTAILNTSMGTIQIQLYDQDAPKTVQNFLCLIARGYYDGIKFHRVAQGFVIQAGDPTGTGNGGESIYGATLEDELYADTPSYKTGYVTGVVAMANAGPNTNGSQFFILLANASLSHNYTIFGKVSSGMDVVQKIGAVPITPVLGPTDGSPKTPVLINKATIK